MKKVIVTTTINGPTPEIQKYDAMDGWRLIVIGDQKTPEYKLERGRFVHCEEVKVLYPELCGLIGFNNTQLGRMVAFLEAHKEGADIIASIDDDCDPHDGWPGKILIGNESSHICRHPTNNLVFDPGKFAYGIPARGVPPQLSRSYWEHDLGAKSITPLVQQFMCDGQPDMDAVYRLHENPDYGPCSLREPVWSDVFSPINTQSMMISGSVLKDHCGEIPFVGHVSDIWAGYLFQAWHPNSTLYCPANVRHWQERTCESVLKDLEEELYSYRHTIDLLHGLKECGPDHLDLIQCLPPLTFEAIRIYRSYFE